MHYIGYACVLNCTISSCRVGKLLKVQQVVFVVKEHSSISLYKNKMSTGRVIQKQVSIYSVSDNLLKPEHLNNYFMQYIHCPTGVHLETCAQRSEMLILGTW